MNSSLIVKFIILWLFILLSGIGAHSLQFELNSNEWRKKLSAKDFELFRPDVYTQTNPKRPVSFLYNDFILRVLMCRGL